MKLSKWAALTLIASNVLFASLTQAGEKLTIGASPVPHSEILEFIKPIVAKQGVDLDIRVFSDYIQPNAQLVSKQLDANYFQYRPFLNDFNRERHTHLVPIVPVHIEPFVAYSQKITDVSQLADGARVAIPNDPVNTGRALVLLHEAGLIKLKDPSNTLATPRDIVDNPKHLKIRELEGALLARSVSQVDLAFVFANYALEAGIDTNSALIVEKGKDLYIEFLVARPDNRNDPRIQKLAKALNSDAVRQFILTRYKGQIAPGF